MKNLFLLVVSTIISISTFLPSITMAAAFQNGSFESGITGWTVVANSGGDGVRPDDGATAGSVSYNFNTFQWSGIGVLAQTFTTTIGQTYLISFDFGCYGLTTGYTQQLRVDMRDGTSAVNGTEIMSLNTASAVVGGNTGFSFLQNGALLDLTDTMTPANDTAYLGPVPTNPEFSTASFSFTALSVNSTLVFSDLTGTSGQYTDSVLDNIVVSPVPEPATVGICLIGLTGLLFRRKLNKSNS